MNLCGGGAHGHKNERVGSALLESALDHARNPCGLGLLRLLTSLAPLYALALLSPSLSLLSLAPTQTRTTMFRISQSLWERIHHFASFPQTGGTLLLRHPAPVRTPLLMFYHL